MSCHDPQFPKPDCETMKTKNECLSVTWTDPNEGPAKCTWTLNPETGYNYCMNQYVSETCPGTETKTWCVGHRCKWVD